MFELNALQPFLTKKYTKYNNNENKNKEMNDNGTVPSTCSTYFELKTKKRAKTLKKVPINTHYLSCPASCYYVTKYLYNISSTTCPYYHKIPMIPHLQVANKNVSSPTWVRAITIHQKLHTRPGNWGG